MGGAMLTQKHIEDIKVGDLIEISAGKYSKVKEILHGTRLVMEEEGLHVYQSWYPGVVLVTVKEPDDA